MNTRLKLVLSALLLFGCGAAHAATNLPLICAQSSAEGRTAVESPCAGAMRFAEAAPSSLVRVCTTSACAFYQRVWKKLADATATQWVEVCSADSAVGPALNCQGTTTSAWGAMKMVPLGDVRKLSVESEVPLPPGAFPGTFTVTPDSGTAPLTITITWDLSAFSGGSCTAAGSWTGSKPLKGTQSVTNINSNASYMLTCERPTANGSANLKWTIPTANVDGSTITNLAGFRVKYGTGATELYQRIEVANPAIDTYTVTNLSGGTWYFAVSAYNSVGSESANSAVVQTTVAAPPQVVTATRNVTITAAPPPPVPLPPVLQVVQADVFNAMADYSLLAFRPSIRYGTAQLGTLCDAEKPIHGGYYPVPRDAVRWLGSGRTSYPVARCDLK